MDQHICIDIHVPKLLEWLISRRTCTPEWTSEVVPIRAKINAAIQDMPEHKDIVSLLSGTYINYFHCLKIIDILKETEADSKNMFGMYSSKRMKDWQAIVNMYTKNNVYLAEAADLLINTVKYEIPSIKKLIAKQYQLENEFKKKATDSIQSGNTARNDLTAFLKELGLEAQTSGYRESLLTSAKQLHSLNEKAAALLKNVTPVLQQYIAFTEYSQPNHKVDVGLIKYISEKGNTTTYEWLNGVKPTKIDLPSLAAEEEEAVDTDDGIDWGYDAGESNIEIELVDSGTLGDTPPEPPIDPNEIVASGDSALSLLDNAATRTNLINQLLEVQSFLKVRIYESDKEGGSVDSIIESGEDLRKMLVQMDEVIDVLTNTTTQHFFNILYSPRYLADLLHKIEAKESAIERCAAIGTMSKERAVEAVNEAVVLNEKSQIISKKSKELQKEIAKDISRRYNGRQVNMMGGIL